MIVSEAPQPKLHPLLWVREIVVIGVVYVVYGFVRNQFGSARLAPGDAPLHAFNNAVHVIDVEKAIGMFHEQSVQDLFLDTWWIPFFNIFYGTAHFVVTLGALIWLFVRRREVFGRWRTTLMATTVLALIGFALFPLMPPRLFNVDPAENRYGGGELAEARGEPDYEWVDTLREVGGLWSFDSEKMDSISNQYAAMPSLHIGWSTWCMLVLWKFARQRWVRWLALLYPFITLTAIVATANHFIIDAAGGVAIVVAGYFIARAIEWVREGRRGDVVTEPASDDDVLVSG